MVSLAKLTLKQQLLLIIGVSTLMIFSLQLYYYLEFYSITETKENAFASRIVKQVEDKLNSYAEDIKDAALASSYNSVAQDYLGSDDPIYRLKLNKSVREIMSGIKSSNKNIQSILLVDREGNDIGASNRIDHLVLKEIQTKYNVLNRSEEQSFFGKVYYNPLNMENAAYFYFKPVYSAVNDSDEFKWLGYCIVIYKINVMDRILSDLKTTQNSVLMILDEENYILSAEDRSMIGSNFGTLAVTITDGNKIEYNQIQNYYQIQTIHPQRWKIISMIPVKEATNELRTVRNVGFLTGIAITIVILMMGFVFMRSVTIPIGKIIRFMNFVAANGEKARLNMKVNNEVGKLSSDINKMLDKIEQINEKVIETRTSLFQMELAKKQAELSSLQSQINPHFLYNTLECIRSIGLAHGIREIAAISTSMAKIFRYSIKEAHFVSVREEMESIQEYLRIMSIRYLDKFQTAIEIDDAILDKQIPKMVLQPVVENAIYHGLERKNGKGLLRITAYRTEDGRIHFEIADNGKGIPERNLSEIQKHLDSVRQEEDRHNSNEGTSLGLKNIHRRIRLVYGADFGIRIDSKENEGTAVRLTFPAETERQRGRRLG